MRREPKKLANGEFDLLVIGGGIHGAFAAWDASLRGLRVALVERGDFLGSTSFNSLKVVHGGLRYIQHLDWPRMRQSIRERRALLRIAPNLVRPLGFVMATRRTLKRSRTALGIALLLNDLAGCDRNSGLGAAQSLPRGRILSRTETALLAPALDTDDATGGALWYDALITNTERLGLSVLHAAAEAGATVANYIDATRLRIEERRATGADCLDVISGEEFAISARAVIDTTGPSVHRVCGGRPPRLTLAMNLVLQRAAPGDIAVGVGRGTDRLFFFVPWRGRTVVGTGHWHYESEPGTPRVGEPEIERFLAEVNEATPAGNRIQREEVALVHAGLLPADESPGAAPGAIRRRYSVEASRETAGLVSVTSVKWTTARALAEEAVDLALTSLGRSAEPCRTAVTPLPCAQLSDPVLTAIRDEMAIHLEDIVFRRTELGSAGPPSDTDLNVCADIAARELGWDAARRKSEIAAVHACYPRTTP